MDEIDIPPVFPPRRIGRCIYCGSTEQLTDEHIIPQALGGKEMLRDATCEECRIKTSAIETRASLQFDVARAKAGVRGKKPDKEQTGHVTVFSGDAKRRIRADLRKVPLTAAFPVFKTARLYAPWSGPNDIKISILSNKKLFDRWRHGELRHEVDPTVFAQMLAKIAHCHVVQQLGLESFEHFLPRFIDKVSDDIFDYVGCANQTIHDASRTEIAKFRLDLKAQSDGHALLIYYVRLMATIRSPEYQIVTGRLPWATRIWPHTSER